MYFDLPTVGAPIALSWKTINAEVNFMNMKRLLSAWMKPILSAWVACFFGYSVSATPIDLGITIGEPASVEDELVRLQGQIALYNAANDPDLPAAVLAGNSGELFPPSEELTSISLDVTGWQYLKLKWDGKDQFYYIGDDSGNLTFNSTVFNDNSQPKALSHYVFYNPTDDDDPHVPDAGSTLALLGFVLAGFGVLRRKITRS
jgi:hypothetical protein